MLSGALSFRETGNLWRYSHLFRFDRTVGTHFTKDSRPAGEGSSSNFGDTVSNDDVPLTPEVKQPTVKTAESPVVARSLGFSVCARVFPIRSNEIAPCVPGVTTELGSDGPTLGHTEPN